MPEQNCRLVSLLHASLLIADLDKSRAFYEGVLGLTPNPGRPRMRFAGIWYDIGQGQIHLIQMPNPDPVSGRPEHGGNDRHIALGVTGFAALQARLDHAGLPYSLSQSGRAALFVRDPDGNTLELMEIAQVD
jgi:glyoxylase I family protein